MGIRWGLTLDCARPVALAEFWAFALGYEPKPVPAGLGSWDEWSAHHGVPEEERGDGDYLQDPTGAGPSLSLLKVPESKVVKNRYTSTSRPGAGSCRGRSGGRWCSPRWRSWRPSAPLCSTSTRSTGEVTT
jgi:hypothetical protein